MSSRKNVKEFYMAEVNSYDYQIGVWEQATEDEHRLLTVKSDLLPDSPFWEITFGRTISSEELDDAIDVFKQTQKLSLIPMYFSISAKNDMPSIHISVLSLKDFSSTVLGSMHHSENYYWLFQMWKSGLDFKDAFGEESDEMIALIQDKIDIHRACRR